MERSPLNKPSAELRNKIYALALHQPEGVMLDAMYTKVTASETALGLTLSCRQLYEETLAMVLHSNEFVFKVHYFDRECAPRANGAKHLLGLLPAWLAAIGETNARLVRTVHIDAGIITAKYASLTGGASDDDLDSGEVTANSADWLNFLCRGFRQLEAIVKDKLGGASGVALRIKFRVQYDVGDYVTAVCYDVPLNDKAEVDRLETRRLAQLVLDADYDECDQSVPKTGDLEYHMAPTYGHYVALHTRGLEIYILCNERWH